MQMLKLPSSLANKYEKTSSNMTFFTFYVFSQEKNVNLSTGPKKIQDIKKGFDNVFV
jgi:hypothetical protein